MGCHCRAGVFGLIGRQSLSPGLALPTSFNNNNNMLFDQRYGVYIEAGALDGETMSNTLALEMDLGWKGLLIEADPASYLKMKSKNRKAWLVNGCLSPNGYVSKVKV